MNQDTRPRLLILTSSFPNGPDDETCGYLRQFARRLSSEFRITVLAPADQQAKLESSEPYKLLRAPSLLPGRFNPLQSAADLNGLRGAGPPVKLAAAIALIGFLIRAWRLARQADVICSHWLLPSGLIGALLSRCLNKPHVAVEHSGALHLLANLRGGKQLARFIVSGSRQVVVVSEDLRRKLIALCPDASGKSRVMAMGVEMNRPAPVTQAALKRTEQTTLFIGRLIAIKGVDVLLEALRDIPDTRLIVAGDGPERNRLERLAAQHAINVEFIGQVNAATRDALLVSCDVVVIPSRLLADRRSEGMPVVCLEAMATGCAVIASRTGGLAEIIRDHHNGFLFEPDDARALADRLRWLLNDSRLRARLGRNARRTAMDYAWPRVAATFARLINDSLNHDASPDYTSARPERAAC